MGVFQWLRDVVRDAIDPPFRIKYFDDDPDSSQLAARTFGVVGTPALRKYAHFRCPCGCGDVIVLTTNSKVRPRWAISVDFWMRPTVAPSVWRTVGCKSHFILERGRIYWA